MGGCEIVLYHVGAIGVTAKIRALVGCKNAQKDVFFASGLRGNWLVRDRSRRLPWGRDCTQWTEIFRAFSPPVVQLGTQTQGVALGWDSGAPAALAFVGDVAAFPT